MTIHLKEKEKRRCSTSTSIAAKQMGLEDFNPNHKLVRFASESTVQRDLTSQQYHFFDTTNFQLRQFNSISPLNGSDLGFVWISLFWSLYKTAYVNK